MSKRAILEEVTENNLAYQSLQHELQDSRILIDQLKADIASLQNRASKAETLLIAKDKAVEQLKKNLHETLVQLSFANGRLHHIAEVSDKAEEIVEVPQPAKLIPKHHIRNEWGSNPVSSPSPEYIYSDENRPYGDTRSPPKHFTSL